MIRSLDANWRLRQAPVLHVGVRGGVGEPEAGVERDRRRVVGLDVEQHLVHAEPREVVQAGEGEHPAEPAALRGRGDADDVDLAERRA